MDKHIRNRNFEIPILAMHFGNEDWLTLNLSCYQIDTIWSLSIWGSSVASKRKPNGLNEWLNVLRFLNKVTILCKTIKF